MNVNLKFTTMKKLTLTVLLVVLIGLTANAQFKFGVQAGLNGTSVTTHYGKDIDRDSKYPVKTKFGFNFGVVAEYEFNDNLGLQSGLLYTQKGYQIDWDQFLKDNNMEGKVDGYMYYKYNYLQLPIHLYYKINDFRIMAGPYLAYGIGGKAKIDATYRLDGESDSLRDETDLTAVSGEVSARDFVTEDNDALFYKTYNAFDIGLDFGVAYQYQQFMLKAQYSIGFNNLTPKIKDYPDFDPNDFSFKNKGFNISVVYMFNE